MEKGLVTVLCVAIVSFFVVLIVGICADAYTSQKVNITCKANGQTIICEIPKSALKGN